MYQERAMDTKNKIKRAFLELHKCKRIEKISIKEITTIAGVNRGTFYAHYLDIYDLQEKIENEIMLGFKDNVIPMIRELIINGNLNYNLLPKDFFYNNKDVVELFLGEAAEPRAIKKLKDFLKSNVLTVLDCSDKLSKEEKRNLDYVLEYVSSAQMAIVGMWFRNNMEIPMDELATVVQKISMEGPITYLKSIIS
ncbi:MAG: TetR/AcrR family transcriptional regulator [Aminipila sp.]